MFHPRRGAALFEHVSFIGVLRTVRSPLGGEIAVNFVSRFPVPDGAENGRNPAIRPLRSLENFLFPRLS
jgi:hypothetical protein